MTTALNSGFKTVFNEQNEEMGPAAGPLAAPKLYPDARCPVIGCDYPLLPSALQ
jgi:hypothetical protein